MADCKHRIGERIRLTFGRRFTISVCAACRKPTYNVTTGQSLRSFKSIDELRALGRRP